MATPDIEPVIAQLRRAAAAPEPAEALAALRAAQALLSQALVALAPAAEEAEPPADDAARFRGPGLGIDPQAEDRLLIERILAMPGISAELRAELSGFRRELESQPLSSADRRYLIALRQRLARVSPRED
jgi:hypothetical protein